MNAGVLLKLIVLKTHDVEGLRRFYQTLGIEFVEEQHGAGPLHYAGTVGETVMEVYPLANGKVVDDSLRLGFAIENLDERLARIDEAGGQLLRPLKETAWGKMALAANPDGRRVELYRAD